MFSFIKLIDGTALIGNIVDESDQTYIIEDAVELGSKNLTTLERQYFFKNVYSPFSTSSEIITEIYKDHIISIHQDFNCVEVHVPEESDQFYCAAEQHNTSKRISNLTKLCFNFEKKQRWFSKCLKRKLR